MRSRVRGGTVGGRQAALQSAGVLIKAQRARDGLGHPVWCGAVGRTSTGAGVSQDAIFISEHFQRPTLNSRYRILDNTGIDNIMP